VAFDLDGTLVKERSSWRKLHEFFGSEGQGDTALLQFERNEITYSEFMERDISRWPKGIKGTVIDRILSDCQIAEGAIDIFTYLRARGIKTAIISSGLRSLASWVAKELRADVWLANDLEVDRNGFLTGRGVLVVDPRRKGELLTDILRGMGLKRENVMAVGDTRFDSSFFAAAGVSVGLNVPADDLELLKGFMNFMVEDLRGIKSVLSALEWNEAQEKH